MRILFVLILTTYAGFGQDQWKNIYSSHAWAERDKWQKPDELIKFLQLTNTSHVADIGCHEGYMTFKLAKVVSNGKVYAVDVDQSKLTRLRQSVAEQQIKNVTVIKGDYDDPRLPAQLLDAVIILDTYHEMEDHDEILLHVKRSLKPEGRLLLCEPIADARRKMKRNDQENKHELGMEYALEDLKKAGFEVIVQYDPFIDRTKEKGDRMWIVVAVPE